MRDVQGQIDRLGQFQIDAINVVARAHQVPLYSRLGGYDTGLLDSAASEAPRRLFEYWGHAASLIDVRLQPALRWRMAAAAENAWTRMVEVQRDYPGLVAQVLADLEERGPLTAREIEHEEVRDRGHWGWNWSAVKSALEWHFMAGEVTTAFRNTQFERAYDLPSRVIPAPFWNEPTPSVHEAHVILARRAAAALGIVTDSCVADYFRTRLDPTRAAIADLVASGELVETRVRGWDRRTWVWHEAARPRSVRARALISPFDSLIFERQRAEELFGLRYRIEIYVPEPQRQYGYYVYPFLLGESFAARVDLKADRAAGVLRVNAAWAEQGDARPAGLVADELATELATMAAWLGLSGVAVEERGDLARTLASAVED